jgi:hypothetical protein
MDGETGAADRVSASFGAAALAAAARGGRADTPPRSVAEAVAQLRECLGDG